MASAEWTKINKKYGGRIPQNGPRLAFASHDHEAAASAARPRPASPQGRKAAARAGRPRGCDQPWLAARPRGNLPRAWLAARASPLRPACFFDFYPCLFGFFFQKIFFLKILKNPSFFHGTSIAPHSSVLSSGQNLKSKNII